MTILAPQPRPSARGGRASAERVERQQSNGGVGGVTLYVSVGFGEEVRRTSIKHDCVPRQS